MQRKRILRAALLILVPTVLMPMFSNCGNRFTAIQNLSSIESSSQVDDTLDFQMVESVGTTEYLVDGSDAIAVGQPYVLEIAEKPDPKRIPATYNWTLASIPEAACSLVPVDETGMAQRLTCAAAAKATIEIQKISGSSFRRVLLVVKEAIASELLAISGRSLYEAKCQACHGAFNTSTVRTRTAAQIANALNQVSIMRSTADLQRLTSLQIRALSFALNTPVTTPPTPPPPPDPTPSLDGPALFVAQCTQCHGALETTPKVGRTLDQIKNAIANQASMKFLSNLTDAQLAAIAKALEPPEVVEVVNVKKKGWMVSRYYIVDLLKEIFESPTYSIQNFVTPVLYKPNVFGTACDVNSTYAAKDCGPVLSGTGAEMNMEGTTVRALGKLKVCEDILTSNLAVMNAATKIGETTSATQPNNIDNIVLPKIFGLFFRSREMTPQELTGYSNMVTALKQKNPTMSNTDLWRAVLLALCESPEWEVL